MYSPIGPGFTSSQGTVYTRLLITAVSRFNDNEGSKAYALSFLNAGFKTKLVLQFSISILCDFAGKIDNDVTYKRAVSTMAFMRIAQKKRKIQKRDQPKK